MEKRQTDFEAYISALSGGLRIGEDGKRDICSEISQNLQDKQNEYLIKGYDLHTSIAKTLDCFEKPEKLAKMLNREYSDNYRLNAVMSKEQLALVVLAATLILAIGLA